MKDRCVMCDKPTVYDMTDHIDIRIGYVEGCGQLCIECYEKSQNIEVPKSLVAETPNDMELGSKVRKLFYNELGDKVRKLFYNL